MLAVLAAVMPKCPLCIAAWLSALGLSSLVSRVDARVVWLVLALLAATAGSAIVHRALSRQKLTKGDRI
jgi:hypothetical protein